MIKDTFVIVQAGGRGSRLRHHTWNKPKCLVSVRGKPILYHLFDRFPNYKFIVIGDYAFDQLESYLKLSPPQNLYKLIRTEEKGTCSGIGQAVTLISPNASILLTWSDLIIHDLPQITDKNYPTACTTSAFTCRWSVSTENDLQEITSSERGIPGIFYFPQASQLVGLPKSGEFVRWFSKHVSNFSILDCPKLEELGEFESIERDNERNGFSRFFNDVQILKDKVVKQVIDPNYEEVHKNEINWYKEASDLNFKRIPKIYSYAPLEMERIIGNHAYQLKDLTERERRAILANSLDSLMELHTSKNMPSNFNHIKSVYIEKTIDRVKQISEVIPNFERESITINGKKCINIFSKKYLYVFDEILSLLNTSRFTPIHGDPTFSNSIVDDKLRIWFIDPRGYFFEPGIMGDPWYDFAKVYYSAKGNYDSFNRKKFKLFIDSETVEILMEDSQFSKTVDEIFNEYFGENFRKIKLIHGLLWLALSGYAKDDIDSVVGSFHLGLYWLGEGLKDGA